MNKLYLRLVISLLFYIVSHKSLAQRIDFLPFGEKLLSPALVDFLGKLENNYLVMERCRPADSVVLLSYDSESNQTNRVRFSQPELNNADQFD